MGFSKVKSIVHVVRHGEVYNPQGVLYGRLPGYDLSEVGQAMARVVADDFEEKQRLGAQLVYCVASPLERAQQTAQPIAQKLGLKVETDQRIIEAANEFQGQVITSGRILRNPKNWLLLRNPVKPSWGEPYRDIVLRMHQAIETARQNAVDLAGDGAEAVMVSHQLPVWVSRRAAEGKSLWHLPTQRECALASVTSFTFWGDSVVEICYTEPAGHLVPLAVRVPDSVRTHGRNTQGIPRALRKTRKNK